MQRNGKRHRQQKVSVFCEVTYVRFNKNQGMFKELQETMLKEVKGRRYKDSVSSHREYQKKWKL